NSYVKAATVTSKYFCFSLGILSILLVYSPIAGLTGPHLLSIGKKLITDSSWPIAFRADHFEVREMNGRLSLGNSALDVALWVRTGVTLAYIYILDEGP